MPDDQPQSIIEYRLSEAEGRLREGAQTFGRLRSWLAGLAISVLGWGGTVVWYASRRAAELEAALRSVDALQVAISDVRGDLQETRVRLESMSQQLHHEREAREQIAEDLRLLRNTKR